MKPLRISTLACAIAALCLTSCSGTETASKGHGDGHGRQQSFCRLREILQMGTNGAERFPEGSTLHACGPDGCAALAEYWTEAIYPARALIVSEDETDDDVFFILSGHARAATYTDSGKEVLMSDLPPGESFGLFAAIDGQPRSTNVIAVDDARIARMSAEGACREQRTARSHE